MKEPTNSTEPAVSVANRGRSHKSLINIARDPLTGLQIRIGAMGSAAEQLEQPVVRLCKRLGRAIAQSGCCLLTGACPGMPHQTVLGAKERGGHVIGISPAVSLREHVEVFDSPHCEYDVLIFTGLGLMGRELINIRSSDIVAVIGGRSGTLGEFAIAFEEGKLIGVLTGTGGITAALPKMEKNLGKKTGAEVIYDDRPERLVRRLLARYVSSSYECPCRPDPKSKCCCEGRKTGSSRGDGPTSRRRRAAP